MIKEFAICETKNVDSETMFPISDVMYNSLNTETKSNFHYCNKHDLFFHNLVCNKDCKHWCK